MTYQHAVNLAPGRYTVEAAVVDHEGNRASTSVLQIDNREQTGVGLSDLTLVRRLETLSRQPDAADPFEYTGERVLPFVTTDMVAGMRPFVYFVVYPEPGNAAKPELRVRFLKGRPVAWNAQVCVTRARCIGRDPDGHRANRQAGHLRGESHRRARRQFHRAQPRVYPRWEMIGRLLH
jgi:hypothetical protein